MWVCLLNHAKKAEYDRSLLGEPGDCRLDPVSLASAPPVPEECKLDPVLAEVAPLFEIRDRGGQFGPYSASQMLELGLAGQLHRGMEIHDLPDGEWYSITEWPGFQPNDLFEAHPITLRSGTEVPILLPAISTMRPNLSTPGPPPREPQRTLAGAEIPLPRAKLPHRQPSTPTSAIRGASTGESTLWTSGARMAALGWIAKNRPTHGNTPAGSNASYGKVGRRLGLAPVLS